MIAASAMRKGGCRSGLDGIRAQNSAIQSDGNLFSCCNGQDGVEGFASDLQLANGGSGLIYSNANFGLVASQSRFLILGSIDFNNGGANTNLNGSVYANDMSIVNIGAASGTATTVPVTGTIGNNNSLITTS